jgi:hypothetical protein
LTAFNIILPSKTFIYSLVAVKAGDQVLNSEIGLMIKEYLDTKK